MRLTIPSDVQAEVDREAALPVSVRAEMSRMVGRLVPVGCGVRQVTFDIGDGVSLVSFSLPVFSEHVLRHWPRRRRR